MNRRPLSAPTPLAVLLGGPAGFGAPAGLPGLSANVLRAAERHDVGVQDIADAVAGVRALDANAYRAAEELSPEERASLIPSRRRSIDARRAEQTLRGARRVLAAIDGRAP